MNRRWKVLAGLVVTLVVLLGVNALITNNETREAEVTASGGEILELPRGAVQVTDTGEPTGPDAGQPVVLLHCYACSLHWYDGIEPLLAENHRVIRLDLLGFGGSEKPEAGYEIENQAAMVAEALNRLGVEGALVAGNSMGAAVATSLAEQASQLVDRVVVIGMGPNTDDYGPGLPFLAQLAYTPVIGQALWRTTPNFIVRNTMAKAFAPGFDPEAGFEDPDRLVDDYRAMTYDSFDQVPDATDEFTAESPLDDRLTRAAVPVLLIFGSEDQIVDADEAIAGYSGVPGAETELLDGLGHAPQVEDPEAVAAILEGFALSLPKPAAKSDTPSGQLDRGKRNNRPAQSKGSKTGRGKKRGDGSDKRERGNKRN